MPAQRLPRQRDSLPLTLSLCCSVSCQAATHCQPFTHCLSPSSQSILCLSVFLSPSQEWHERCIASMLLPPLEGDPNSDSCSDTRPLLQRQTTASNCNCTCLPPASPRVVEGSMCKCEEDLAPPLHLCFPAAVVAFLPVSLSLCVVSGFKIENGKTNDG